MKNILQEKPKNELHGRMLESIRFVAEFDLINKNILDIGCGYGWFEFNILQKKFNKLVGVETAEKNLEIAKDSIKHDKVFFEIGSAIDLPFGDNSFDTVVTWEVIEHIPKNTENKMLQEVARVLKNGGIFYFSTPYKAIINNFTDPAWWLIGHRHYSTNKLITLLRKNGFEVLEIRKRGRYWDLFGSLNMYFSKWILRRAPICSGFFNRKIDEEYKKGQGFSEIFIKAKNQKNHFKR